MKRSTKRETKSAQLNRLLTAIVDDELFDLVVISDQSGLIVSSISNSNIEARALGALSAGMNEVTKQVAKYLQLGNLNYMIINSSYGELMLAPVEIKGYSKDFILSGLINEKNLTKIKEKEFSVYEKLVSILIHYSDQMAISRKTKATASNIYIDDVSNAAEAIKEVFQ